MERTGTLVTSGVGIGSTGGNGNDDTLLVFKGVRPDEFGQVFIEVERAAGSYAYLGLLEIVVRRPAKVSALPASF